VVGSVEDDKVNRLEPARLQKTPSAPTTSAAALTLAACGLPPPSFLRAIESNTPSELSYSELRFTGQYNSCTVANACCCDLYLCFLLLCDPIAPISSVCPSGQGAATEDYRRFKDLEIAFFQPIARKDLCVYGNWG
jgi:hypothetical protein